MKNVKLLILLSVLSFSLSANAMADKIEAKEKNNITTQDNSGQQDMMVRMEEMQKHMDKVFQDQRQLMAQMMEQSKKNMAIANMNTASNNSSVKTIQNERSYVYELTFSSFKKEDVVVEVKDRVLTLWAKSDQLKEEKATKEKITSAANFYYSLLLPQDANPLPKIMREDKKITVTFTKNKAATR